MNTNCASAAGRATAIQARLPRQAPDNRQDALRERQQQREDQREMSEFGVMGLSCGVHCLLARAPWLMASFSSFGI